MFTFPFTNFIQSFTNKLSTSFNGVDERIDFTDISVDPNNFSISFWVKMPLQSGTTYLFYKYDVNERVFMIGVNATGKLFVSVSEDGNTLNKTRTSSYTVTDDQWHHVVFTFTTPDTLGLYVDNVYYDVNGGTVVNSLYQVVSSFYIGGNNGSALAQCKLDEVTIWNTATLGASEVSALYNNGVPQDPRTITTSAVLQNWYRMGDGDSATTLFDQKGSNDGTLFNMDATNYTSDVPT